jgi:integrase
VEFRRSKPERRPNRRICPKCQIASGAKKQCPRCRTRTEARIQLVWFINGKRYRELTYCWRERDASEILQRKEADYWRQQDLGVDREIGGSLREAADAFINTLTECSDDYKKQIGTSLGALANGLGWDRPVPQISAQDIESYKEDGLFTLAPTTVRSYMLVLRRFFAYLHQEGWIRRNPTVRIKLPRAGRRRDHLRPEEVGRVLEMFWQVSPTIAPIATALILGGWRKGEIINLRHADVNLAERWAYVVDFDGDAQASAWSPKSESSWRAVPLHPIVVAALKRVEPVTCPDGRESPWVFPVADRRKRRRYKDKRGRMQPVYGDRRSPGTSMLGSKLNEVMAAVGIERRVTIHGLRRTFAVLLQEAGAPDAIIRQALGHGARGVTETHYLPRRDDVVKRYVDAIEIEMPVEMPIENSGSADQPDTRAQLAASIEASEARDLDDDAEHCHQSATNVVANEPPDLPYMVPAPELLQ